MKKSLLLLLVLCVVFFGNAQTIGKNGTVQMPNFEFEEYHTGTLNGYWKEKNVKIVM